jgi:hypothetical protein
MFKCPSRLTSAVLLIATPLFMTCAGDTSGPRVPASVARVGGDTQTGIVGQALPAALAVRVLDAGGTGVPDINVTWAVTAGGGTLSATGTTTDAGGSAQVALTLGTTPGTNTVTASVAGLAPIEFSSTAVVGPPATLSFLVQPSPVTAGVAIAPAVQVSVRDALGNTVTTSTASITVAITSGTGAPGAVLGGTLTRAAVSGVASFDNLTIDKSGNGYTLAATTTGLTAATSAPFTVNAGAPSQLAFIALPAAAVAGAAMSPAVQVAIQDALGNTVASSTTNVTLAISVGTGAAGAVLGGTLSRAAVSGVATYGDLTIDKSGAGYSLTATATGLTSATSSGFTVSAGAAAKLAFTVQPSAVTAGSAVSPAVQVTVQDALGNVATNATNSITVAITPGTGTGGAVLSGTVTSAAVGGVAMFSDLSINRSGAGYTLTASAAGLTGAASGVLAVNAGAASKLAFTVAPGTVVAGVAMSPALQVTVQDALGNTVTGATNSITLAFTPGSGPVGLLPVLGGTLTRQAVNGTATFDDVTIDKAGSGYSLTAAATGLTSAISAAFTVASGGATKLAAPFPFLGPLVAGTANPNQVLRVEVQDAVGNVVTASTAGITVAITSGTGTPGATLGGTLTKNALSGVALFNDLTIDRVGSGYTLTATASGLTSATSTAFGVILGAPASIGKQSGDGQTAITATMLPIAPAVVVRDPAGNATPGVAVTFAVASGGGAVSGASQTTNASGVATVGSWTLGPVAGVNTLTATAAGAGISGNPATFSATGSGNVWTTLPAMPTQRTDLAVGVVNGILYAVGGKNSTANWVPTVEAYDPATNTWSSKAPLPTERTGLAIGVVNGILYAVGGANSTSPWLEVVEAYDPATNTWATKAPMPTARTDLAVGVVNGILYAVGGRNSTGFWITTVEAYDPVANSWTSRASLTAERTNLGVGVVNGILYAVGGANSTSEWLDNVDAFDPVANSWTAKAPLPSARTGLAVGVANGILYAFGGANSSGPWLDVVEAYDPAGNSWVSRAVMPTARTELAAGTINGILFSLGGANSTGSWLSTAEVYHP